GYRSTKTRSAMKNEIQQLEKKYWEAISAQDFQTIKDLTRFPCILAGKRGILRLDEPTYKSMFDADAGELMQVKALSDTQIQLGQDYAVIAYVIAYTYQGQAMKSACTSTWVKENGRWLCV